MEWWRQLRPSEADLKRKVIKSNESIRETENSNRMVRERSREVGSVQRIVVLPALSRPRTRIRASLLPKREENNLVNTIPIFRFGRVTLAVQLQLAHKSVTRVSFLNENAIRSQSREFEQIEEKGM